jgi:SpoIIAA-like
MAITMQHAEGNVYTLELSGVLGKGELDRCQEQLVGEMDRVGPVKLLVVLRGFDGWGSDGNWNDMSFYLRHGDRIERIAIVGPERWRTEAMMFAGADLRKAPVEYFGAQALADARSWLSS